MENQKGDAEKSRKQSSTPTQVEEEHVKLHKVSLWPLDNRLAVLASGETYGYQKP
jgi:hypothetical protein